MKNVDLGDDGKSEVRFSVIIPNFNHGSVVSEAVHSLTAQVPAPNEIIVVDDGSTDNSLAVLNQLQLDVPPLRIISLAKNGGAISALNRGLAEARGKFIYFGAADDVTRPGLFNETLKMLERFPEAAFACCEGVVVDLDTGKTAVRPPARPAQTAVFLSPVDVARTFRRIDNWVLTGTAVIRRDLMADAGGFDLELGAFADGYALRRLALLCGCCFVPYIGLVWRVKATGLSRTQAADPEATLRTLNVALSRMRADPVFPHWYPPIFQRRWRFSVGRLAVLSRPMNKTVLMRVSARGALGRAILALALWLDGSLGRTAALGWLTVQERPISFWSLIATKLCRLFYKLRV